MKASRPGAGLRAGVAALALGVGVMPVLAQSLPKPARAASSAAAAAAPASAPASSAAASAYGQRFATVCAACHGANGRSGTPLTPVLAGQPSLYTITQLFLFREGRRGDAGMTAIAKTLNDDDLRGFSSFVGTLAPVPAPAPDTPPDTARMAAGRKLAQEHKCVFCHGADFAGGQQVPRIGGQHEAYLKASLHGFKDGTRPGYTRAMTEALNQVPPADLDVLAYFLARVPVALSAGASK
ncbi:MAG: c-type cytochrome [Rubrivivax sp.]